MQEECGWIGLMEEKGGEDLEGGYRGRSDGKEVVVILAAGERALSDSHVKMNKSVLNTS
jgi:hypothetical protein